MAAKPKRRAAAPPPDPIAPDPLLRQPVLSPSGAVLREALVTQAAWADPDDQDRLQRNPRMVEGFRAVSVIWNLHQRNPRDFTETHLRAARAFTRDHELAEGARNAGGGGSGSETGPTESQIDAIGRRRRALAALGPSLGMIVQLVVLSNVTLAALAETLHTSADRAAGRLAAALDRLCDHYFPPVQNGPGQKKQLTGSEPRAYQTSASQEA